jgi:hypothetical protein
MSKTIAFKHLLQLLRNQNCDYFYFVRSVRNIDENMGRNV